MRSLDLYLKKRVSRFAGAAAIFDGRRRYVVATLLWLCYVSGSVPPHGIVASALLYPRFLLCAPDLYLNVRGLLGRRHDGATDGPVAVHEMDHDFTQLNAVVRPYLLVIAAIFAAAFVGWCLIAGIVDLRWLRWSIAMLALGFSMYLKEIDRELAVREHEVRFRRDLAVVRSRY